MNIDFEAIAFVIMSLMAILGALGCVYARRVAHSLLSLMMTFFAVAGVFVLAHAELLAADSRLSRLGHAGRAIRRHADPPPDSGR